METAVVVRQMNHLLPLAADRLSEMPMKNPSENQPIEMIAREVTHIIFGEENLSEMHLRQTRIALERYHGQEIIPGLPETAGGMGCRLNTPTVGVNR